MGSLKGKTPGATYTKLAVVKDPANQDFVLVRDRGDGNDEVLPLWTSIDSTNALQIKNASGTSSLAVDTIMNVVNVSKLRMSTQPTTDTDVTPKSYVDKNNYKFQKFSYLDATNLTNGVGFTLTSTPLEGSVQVIINGVYYLSNNTQTDTTSPTDFYIGSQLGSNLLNQIVIVNTASGGSINLHKHDEIGIYYQKA